MCKFAGLMAAILAAALVSPGQTEKNADHWSQWQFLMGRWIGEGSGGPGQSTGWFTFNRELQGRVLVRKNRAEYPATKDRPGYSHDDLMIVFEDPSARTVRADFFDNEGHVIRYAVEMAADSSTITFLSDRQPSAPRFRLTYFRAGEDKLRFKFEIAPPDQPDAFKTYLEGALHKEHSTKE